MTSDDTIRDLFSNPDRRKELIEALVLIEDKDRQVVPFILNPIQVDMISNSTWRDVYVKPAQVGGTSLIMCDFLLDCLIFKGTTSVIISYDEFITGRLLRKAQLFYDQLFMRIPSLPKMHHKSTFEKTFIFEDRMGARHGESSFYISSAKGFAMPRGEPIHDLLMDELAFWPAEAAARAFAAALQRVPLRAGAKVRAVSTPNGEGNDFYELYMAAKEGRETGKSVFKHHFYPWFAMPEYSLTADSDFALPNDKQEMLDNLSTDEIKLLESLHDSGISREEAFNKLRWRRYKVAEMQSLRRSGETGLLFQQEYPEDDVSCFQSAGDEWYPHEDVNRLVKECYPAPTTYLGAEIWYPPEEGHRYLMAIDPGLGKQSESVATIWEFTQDLHKHCATYTGYYAGKEMAERCFPIARFYNNATIANEDALDITSHLISYGNLYYRTDPVTGKVSNNIGWQTNLSTKVYMCNEVRRTLPITLTHDIRVVSQLRNIREGMSRGRIIPISVGADDYHDSMAIAKVCRDSVQVEAGLVGSKGWSDDWGR